MRGLVLTCKKFSITMKMKFLCFCKGEYEDYCNMVSFNKKIKTFMRRLNFFSGYIDYITGVRICYIGATLDYGYFVVNDGTTQNENSSEPGTFPQLDSMYELAYKKLCADAYDNMTRTEIFLSLNERTLALLYDSKVPEIRTYIVQRFKRDPDHNFWIAPIKKTRQ